MWIYDNSVDDWGGDKCWLSNKPEGFPNYKVKLAVSLVFFCLFINLFVVFVWLYVSQTYENSRRNKYQIVTLSDHSSVQ